LTPKIEIAFWYAAGRLAGMLRPRRRTVRTSPPRETSSGISVVIPSRNGRNLLSSQLAGIVRELAGFDAEIIVVDNGSDDGTAGWMATEWPEVKVEVSGEALSFARAVNRGIARARYGHVCLLNNDMVLDAGFFQALREAFERVPDLFCATAQIFFPEGVRREETGKAVYAQPRPEDFPIRCDEPLVGEDLTWVLYGSGGCSLYDAAKLRALGGLDEAYGPAYVEDLDIGYRAWLHGWPSVYVAGAKLVHRHRATSSRYYTQEELDAILERNYLKFLARGVASQKVFSRMWRQALARLRLTRRARLLREAWCIALEGGGPEEAEYSEERLLALCGGDVAVMPGGAEPKRPVTVIAGEETDFPPQGAVLVMQVEDLAAPPPEWLARCAEIVLVRRSGGPVAFQAAFHQTIRKWRPEKVRE
jgi:GT2 family glycosyltransferase